jgi:hypothetical protein
VTIQTGGMSVQKAPLALPGTIDGTGKSRAWTPLSSGGFPIVVTAEDGAGCRARQVTGIPFDSR